MVAIFLIPLLMYSGTQTIRDYRRKSWIMAVWGAMTSALLLWLLEAVTRGPGY